MNKRFAIDFGSRFIISLMVAVLVAAASLVVQPQQAHGIECNGAASAEDCLHVDSATYSGNYRTVLGGDGIFEDNSSGSFSLTVPDCIAGPANIVSATLSWALRDTDAAWWDETVSLAVDGGTPATINADSRFKAHPSWTC